jgi:cytochrome c556
MRLLIATSVLLIGSVLAAQVIRQENVATTKQLMETLVIPASNAVFEAAGKDNPTEADWQEFRKNALILAESANLLLTPGRASTGAIRGEAKAKAKAKGKAPAANPVDWNRAAVQLRDGARMALAAIEKKDLDALGLDAGDKILQACTACHDKYMIK